MSSSSSQQNHILVIEDSGNLANDLVINLKIEGYHATCVRTGMDAITTVATHAPDLIILDVLLPDMSGLAVLEAVRQAGYKGGVMVLSGLISEWDQKLAYRLGANRYITKPVDMMYLLECAKAELARSIGRRTVTPNHSKRIEINRDSHLILVQGIPIHFTPKQFGLLAYIVEADGRAVPKRELLKELWGLDEDVNTTTLETHLKQIRAKLEPFGLKRAIVSVSKIGYRWSWPRWKD